MRIRYRVRIFCVFEHPDGCYLFFAEGIRKYKANVKFYERRDADEET